MNRRSSDKKMQNNERGAALVEFAIVATLLFVLLFGIIDYGLLFKNYLALNQVARESVRILAVGGEPDIDVLANQFGIKGQVEKLVIDRGVEKGDRTKVELAYNHKMITGLFGSANRTLHASMVMRKE